MVLLPLPSNPHFPLRQTNDMIFTAVRLQAQESFSIIEMQGDSHWPSPSFYVSADSTKVSRRLPVYLTEKSRRLHRYADFTQILRRGLTDYTDYTDAIRAERYWISSRMALRNLRNLRDLKNYTRPKLNLGGHSPDSDANREFHEKGLTQIPQIRRFHADSSKRSHRLHGLHRCHPGGTLFGFHPDGICVIRVICETFPITSSS